MAMPQRDDPPTPRLRRTGKIEAIKRLEPPSRKHYGGPGALLEYAVMHNGEAEAARQHARQSCCPHTFSRFERTRQRDSAMRTVRMASFA